MLKWGFGGSEYRTPLNRYNYKDSEIRARVFCDIPPYTDGLRRSEAELRTSITPAAVSEMAIFVSRVLTLHTTHLAPTI